MPAWNVLDWSGRAAPRANRRKRPFAEKVADWNRDIESRGKAKELERATTGRTCVTVVHVRYC